MDRVPLNLLRSSQRGPRLIYKIGLGWLIGPLILLLTTTGRKSGLPRVTALQYEKLGDDYLLGAFRGSKADWYRNLAANPRAWVQVGRRQFSVHACLDCDPDKVFDFLKLRLNRHPFMVGAMLRFEGIRPGDKNALRAYASRLALVVLTPLPEGAI